MSVHYELVIESVTDDEYADVVDCEYVDLKDPDRSPEQVANKAAQIVVDSLLNRKPAENQVHLGICRRVCSDHDGDEVDRHYAYPRHNSVAEELPDLFDRGDRVPDWVKARWRRIRAIAGVEVRDR